MKPLIVITYGVNTKEEKLINYKKTIERFGGKYEYIISMSEFKKKKLDEKINGLLLPGGGDADSSSYCERNFGKVKNIDTPRDKLETELVRYAIKNRIPMLGICRGCQMLNIATGGTLMQDIYTECKNPLRHSPVNEKSQCDEMHQMKIKKGTFIFGLFKDILDSDNEVTVNSYHHQALKKLGKGLVVSAVASDGIIEAVESKDKKHFCIGVQFHPERMRQTKLHEKLFKEFIKISRKPFSAMLD
ncbi:MAG: gamma-glutamyl-gamma-aminobutyrate hydrolase family protein [bacterium]|nr:gamma-glutamyl-gamma-aminobutyrate hydrolase family protein [bacterium]